MDTTVVSPQIEEHFARPRNLGRLPTANGQGRCGDLQAGPTQITIAIQVVAGQVVAARFRTFGCSVAIAASSVATTLISDQPVTVAATLTADQITAALGVVPAERAYAPAMAATAVRLAVADWAAQEERKGQGDGGES
jgi:NifU-like protein involved in Fe-S cluster formation